MKVHIIEEGKRMIMAEEKIGKEMLGISININNSSSKEKEISLYFFSTNFKINGCFVGFFLHEDGTKRMYCASTAHFFKQVCVKLLFFPFSKSSKIPFSSVFLV